MKSSNVPHETNKSWLEHFGLLLRSALFWWWRTSSLMRYYILLWNILKETQVKVTVSLSKRCMILKFPWQLSQFECCKIETVNTCRLSDTTSAEKFVIQTRANWDACDSLLSSRGLCFCWYCFWNQYVSLHTRRFTARKSGERGADYSPWMFSEKVGKVLQT